MEKVIWIRLTQYILSVIVIITGEQMETVFPENTFAIGVIMVISITAIINIGNLFSKLRKGEQNG